ncbi:MAG: serine/threonine-protein phosphatase [Phycisphaeraceae bacterium]|nr:serine/threonine-protein phosphatase [Phycisphaerales bacterium]MCB9860964.1 serine/threonine-protein phosphatase [Phycisphaeraceae bacterium]
MQCLEVWGGNVATNTAFVMPGLDAWIYSKPFADPNIQTENHTEDAGGDIHYLSSCATGRISRLLVADVAGHGKSVAKVTSTLASLLRKHSNQVNMTRFVHGLNREFVAHSEAGIFATAVAATYWAPTNQMILCNAGHPKPLLYRSKTGAWEFIVGEALAQPVNAPHQPNNVPLGITDLVSYTATTVNMEPGDLMLLYTDSMIEARSPFGEFIGQQGLVNLMNTLDPNPTSLIPSLLAKLNEFRGGADDNDDVTAMLLRSTSFSQSRVSQTALAGMTMGRALVDKLLHPDKPFPRLEMSDGIKKLKDLGFARPELLTLRDITS